MSKVIVDTSIIDGNYQEFLKLVEENVMVLSKGTFKELQQREKDFRCAKRSKIYAKRLIRYFAGKALENADVIQLVSMDNEDRNGHFDHQIVEWAKENDAIVYTGDYGMSLDCLFNGVEVFFAEHKDIVCLQYIECYSNGIQLNLTKVPGGESIFVISRNGQIKKARDWKSKYFELWAGDMILSAKSSGEGECILTTYMVTEGGQEISKEDESVIEDSQPLESLEDENQKALLRKWREYMRKSE